MENSCKSSSTLRLASCGPSGAPRGARARVGVSFHDCWFRPTCDTREEIECTARGESQGLRDECAPCHCHSMHHRTVHDKSVKKVRL